MSERRYSGTRSLSPPLCSWRLEEREMDELCAMQTRLKVPTQLLNRCRTRGRLESRTRANNPVTWRGHFVRPLRMPQRHSECQATPAPAARSEEDDDEDGIERTLLTK